MKKLLSLVAILVLIIGGSIFWQRQADEAQKNLDTNTQLSYITAQGEVVLAYPKDWEATENSFDLIEDGLYTLELESPTNDIAVAAVKERLDFDLREINEVETDEGFVKALTSPQADLFNLIEINTASANTYELYETLDEWFEEYSEGIDVASGVSVSKPEPFEIKQGDAIQFYTSIVQNEKTIRTWHVFALGIAGQVEAVVYTADSSQFSAAQEIIGSMVITDILLGT